LDDAPGNELDRRIGAVNESEFSKRGIEGFGENLYVVRSEHHPL
jgi:hypothetical protein